MWRPLRLKFLRGLIIVLHSMAHFTGHKRFEPGTRVRVSWTSQPHLHTQFNEGTSMCFLRNGCTHSNIWKETIVYQNYWETSKESLVLSLQHLRQRCMIYSTRCHPVLFPNKCLLASKPQLFSIRYNRMVHLQYLTQKLKAGFCLHDVYCIYKI